MLEISNFMLEIFNNVRYEKIYCSSMDFSIFII